MASKQPTNKSSLVIGPLCARGPLSADRTATFPPPPPPPPTPQPLPAVRHPCGVAWSARRPLLCRTKWETPVFPAMCDVLAPAMWVTPCARPAVPTAYYFVNKAFHTSWDTTQSSSSSSSTPRRRR